MRIQVNSQGRPPELFEPRVFDAFDVVVCGPPTADPRSALKELGAVTEDASHVFIEPEAVKALAGVLAAEPGWRSSFEAMIAFASDHGWTDDRGRIRAHVITETNQP